MSVDQTAAFTILTERGETRFYHPRQAGLELHLASLLKGEDRPLPALPDGYHCDTVVVIGAGLGAEAFQAAQSLRPRRILCFEPDGVLFGMLSANLANLAGAECLPWGLLDRDGVADLYPGRVNCAGHAMTPGPATTGEPHTVEVRQASAELARLQVQAIALAIIDTGGGEAAILHSLGGLLARTDLLRISYCSETERRQIDRMTEASHVLAWARVDAPNQGILLYQHRRQVAAKATTATTISAAALSGRGWRALNSADLPEAERCFRAALAINATDSRSQHGLGLAALRTGDLTMACLLLRGALINAAERAPIRPDFSAALDALDRRDRAEDAPLLLETASHMAALGEVALAERALGLASRFDPSRPEPLWMHDRIAPRAYRDEAEMAAWRTRLIGAIHRLEKVVPTPTTRDEADKALSGLQILTNFPLAYFGEDERETQESFGRLTCRLMGARFPEHAKDRPQPRRSGDTRIRIGYCSANFSAHTISLLFNGWIRHADRQRFKLHIYVVGGRRDQVTETFARQAERFADLRSADLASCVETIAADELDILVYPDLGMDTRSFCLAGLRLASLQCVSWGHPITTGLASMDVFLTSDLMEPAASDAHYSEKLIRLPRLSVAYLDPSSRHAPASRAGLGLPDGLLYLCSQAQQKYLPAHDWLFPAIAAKVPNAKFVFVLHNKDFFANEAFQRRMDAAFRAKGLDPAAHLVYVAWLPWEDFLGLNQVCDVFLDSIGWSGGNTALEALSHHLPIVTLPGPLMRSRHSYAFLKLLEVEDGIASDLDDYVARAARLGTDAKARQAMVDTIRARRERLFDDALAVKALEEVYVAELGKI
jgi:FkbM family methyltransferase